MKLLLTSAGISNKSIEKAFFELAGKKAEQISLAFIPTASNVEAGDKWWVIKDLVRLQEMKIKCIDIVDISALDKKQWQPRLEAADVLYFEGGNTYHLIEWVRKSGLEGLLPELLKTRLYVGVSAGSMITNKNLSLRQSQILYEEDFDKKEDMNALGIVDFYFLPHLKHDYFKKVNEENVRKVAKETKEKIYALDDNSALKIIDGNVEVISEGKYLILN